MSIIYKSQSHKLTPDPTSRDTPSLTREGEKFARELRGELKTTLTPNT
jgi:hypothetical protein